MSSQSLGSWPADAGLLRPRLLPGRTSAGGNSRGVTWRAPTPCYTSWREPILFVKTLDRIHSLSVRKWTPHLLCRSTKRHVHARQVSWPNDSQPPLQKIHSHSTPNTRFRGFLKALSSCHSCLVINYMATDGYAHNPKVGGSNPSPATIPE